MNKGTRVTISNSDIYGVENGTNGRVVSSWTYRGHQCVSVRLTGGSRRGEVVGLNGSQVRAI